MFIFHLDMMHPDRPIRPMKHKYETLDAITGLAAIAVVIWHAEPLFGWRPASGYLAVDLFFMLSGFVIAHAYDGKLAGGLGAGQFMVQRGIRLYPLYILGTGISALGLLAAFAVGASNNWTPGGLVSAVLLGGAFLPAASANGTLYPLNPPAWSLLSELVVNFVFAAAFLFFSLRRLLITASLAFIVLIATTAWFGDLNTGSKWVDAIGALPRVFFAFPVGMALCRLHRDHGWKIDISPVVPLAAVAALLSIALPGHGAYDLFVVLVLFPAIVLAGASREMPRFQAIAAFLGSTSYAVYALHIPLLALFTRAAGIIFKAQIPVLAGGICFLVAVLIAAWIADLVWDKPVRIWLTRRLVPRKDPANLRMAADGDVGGKIE